MLIHRITSGWLEENCYIYYDEKTRKGYIIDPGEDGRSYLSYIKAKNISIEAVLLTHHHSDHSGAAAEVADALGVPVYIHENDRSMYPADRYFKEGDSFGSLEVIHTPGHTMGSVCFYDSGEKLAFTGDTVFNVDLGRTDFEDGSALLMAESVQRLDSMWSDEITIYPGHGGSCTMEYVRRVNTEFKEMTK